jgi:AhpD family alkylhydroperoxidase
VVTLKEAKTGEEMLESWQELVGDGDIEDVKEAFQVYAKKMPDIIKRYCHEPLVASNERAILDAKTRELVLVGMLAAMGCGVGVMFHIMGAKHAGCTMEEIMEVIYLAGYEHAKVSMANLALSVTEGLRRAEKMKS